MFSIPFVHIGFSKSTKKKSHLLVYVLYIVQTTSVGTFYYFMSVC